MPKWTTDPPDHGEGPALPIRRTPASGKLLAVITTEQLIGCDTHFYQGHTVPCERPDCDACRDGIPFRWHGYVAATDYNSHLHFIFEMTAAAAEAFKNYRDAHGTLRGCLFQAERLHRRPNGRVIIQTKPVEKQHILLPKPPDMVSCMSIIWQLPRPEVTLAGNLKGVPRITTQETRPGN